MVDISILTMVYKPTYTFGAPPCRLGRSGDFPLPSGKLLQFANLNIAMKIVDLPTKQWWFSTGIPLDSMGVTRDRLKGQEQAAEPNSR